MANTVSATLQMFLQAVETLDLDEDQATDPSITHRISGSGYTSQLAINAATTPVASKVWSDEVAMTDGDESIDLTALAREVLPTVDMAGLKIQAFMIVADSANTAAIVIKPHATNGYNLFGDADGQVTLFAGGAIMGYMPEDLPDVANGSADIIQITSSDLDAKFKIILVAG